MNTSTVITATVVDHIHRWVRFMAERNAHLDRSLFDYAAVGTAAWQEFWGDLFVRPCAEVRNPLQSAWFAPLHRAATAADLDAMEAAFRSSGRHVEGMTCLRFLQYDLLREARKADSAGLEVSVAIPAWFRAKGWSCGAPWGCEEVSATSACASADTATATTTATAPKSEPEPASEPADAATIADITARLERARANYNSALMSDPSHLSWNRVCANLQDEVDDLERELLLAQQDSRAAASAELEDALHPKPAPLGPAPQDAAGNWRGRIASAAQRYRELEARGAPPAELATALQHYKDHWPPGGAPEFPAADAAEAAEDSPAPALLPAHNTGPVPAAASAGPEHDLDLDIAHLQTLQGQAWADRACAVLHNFIRQEAYAAAHPTFRQKLEALTRQARGNVYFRHCYLSVAEDMQWILDRLLCRQEYVAGCPTFDKTYVRGVGFVERRALEEEQERVAYEAAVADLEATCAATNAEILERAAADAAAKKKKAEPSIAGVRALLATQRAAEDASIAATKPRS
jgi:hypothetical protein